MEQSKFGIVNADDSWGERMKEMTSFPVFTYGVHNHADFRATDVKLTVNSTSFYLDSPAGSFEVKMALIGEFNVYNA
ncbi:Mur ligase family protein, partial [Escherichia coli]|uniref:Mur ligase family protein n=1 Tax=Escherichia coli TaxID=562 RepID=UPI0034D2577C